VTAEHTFGRGRPRAGQRPSTDAGGQPQLAELPRLGARAGRLWQAGYGPFLAESRPIYMAKAWKNIEEVELGTSGQRVSQLALGCMQMGTLTSEGDALSMLDRYAELGGSFLDTANAYGWFLRRGSRGGESEAVIGRWLRERGQRDRVFVATKAGAMVASPDAYWATGAVDWPAVRRNFEGAGRATLERELAASLRRLGTDYVDLFYVHVDDRNTPLAETLSTLASFVQAGKVRFIGWSNVRTWRLERIRQLCAREGWPMPVAVQQQHTYLRRRQGLDSASIVDDEQLDYLRAHPDLSLVAYSPILKGLYSDSTRRRGHWAMEPYVGADSEARLSALHDWAGALAVDENQLVLAWLLHQDSPRVLPLIGPRTPEQLEHNLMAREIELSPEVCEALSNAGG
jgi:aryl-alcohol dehydrogenase-like predicted oxidoreductase